jgi:uncharacterized protein YutE (UPF0331/DUF86 family)
MVDAARLRAILEHLADAESMLVELRDRGADEVRSDVHLLNSTKYLFIVAAEAAIDAGQHILASEAGPVPATFAEVFEELGRSGYLSEELAASLVSLARRRWSRSPLRARSTARWSASAALLSGNSAGQELRREGRTRGAAQPRPRRPAVPAAARAWATPSWLPTRSRYLEGTPRPHATRTSSARPP